MVNTREDSDRHERIMRTLQAAVKQAENDILANLMRIEAEKVALEEQLAISLGTEIIGDRRN